MTQKFDKTTEKHLNNINEKYSINDPDSSLYVIDLIENHDIRSEAELVEQIADHQEGCERDECEVESGGTLEDFAEQLYEAQAEEFGTDVYDYETCYEWVYDLFVCRSLRGRSLEEKAIDRLTEEEKAFSFVKAEKDFDVEKAVDIVVRSGLNNEVDIAGVQVKPESYEGTADRIKLTNQRKNEQYDHPVFYLFYDDDEEFVNVDEVMEQLNAIATELMYQ